MATRVIMPKAGMAMEEGLIVSWLKKPGDAVERGEAIAEIETDKAAMEIEAEDAGVLIAVLRQAGERVAVTETIAWIGKEGEVPPAGGAKRVAATPAARRQARDAGLSLSAVAVPEGAAVRADDVRRHIRRDATPLASRIAAEAGIDPASAAGPSGGRARKADVLREAAAHSAAGGTEGIRRDRLVPFTAIQRIAGERLLRSHLEIPSVTIFVSADATELLGIRASLNEGGRHKISLNDLLVMACAKALADNPRANAVVEAEGLLLKGAIDIGIAVATEGGLLVPTLRGADKLPVAELSRRARDLADRARARRLKPDELEGGTFTVSNVGMYGVSHFTPIINQPQVGILGVGAAEERLALGSAGTPVSRKALPLSFTFDHRALDGAEAAAFLKAVRDMVERPLLILA
jgi:pyruvate dehydrogenase E2 component (dihydrolipoamide acetyltransferase)